MKNLSKCVVDKNIKAKKLSTNRNKGEKRAFILKYSTESKEPFSIDLYESEKEERTG